MVQLSAAMNKRKIQILSFVINLPLAVKRVSATLGFVYTHLMNGNYINKIIDVEIYGLKNKFNMIKNFSFNPIIWSFKRQIDINRKMERSKLAKIKYEKLKCHLSFNVILQIGSEFTLSNIKEFKRIPKFSYHDNNLMAYLKSAHNLPLNRLRYAEAIEFEKKVYDILDGIFTMTEFLRKSFIMDFKVPEHKVHNIGFGCNLGEVKDFEKTYDNNIILFVAKDSFKEKGGYVLLNAFKKVKMEIRDTELYIVGQKLNIKYDGVKYINFIDKTKTGGEEKLQNLYRHSFLFVMPSYIEAAGNVFLEAMANKLPCIGADVQAMPEIIVGNKSGFVTKPGDSDDLANKIIEILKNKEFAKELGNNGFKAIQQKYNWNIVCEKAIEIMKEYI